LEPTLYAVLGTAETASPQELKAAFREQAKKHHPDANGGSARAADRFKRAKAAYDTLSVPETRAAYDRWLRHQRDAAARRDRGHAGAARLRLDREAGSSLLSRAVAYSPSGNYLAARRDDWSVVLFESSTGERVGIGKLRDKFRDDFVVTDAGSVLAAAPIAGDRYQLVSALTGETVWRREGFGPTRFRLPSWSWCLLGSGRLFVRFENALCEEYAIPSGAKVSACRITPPASVDSLIDRVFDAALKTTFRGPTRAIRAAGANRVVIDWSGAASSLYTTDGRLLRKLKQYPRAILAPLAGEVLQGQVLRNGGLRRFRASDGRQLSPLNGLPTADPGRRVFCSSADGRVLLARFRRWTLGQVSPARDAVVWVELPGSDEFREPLAISPDGARVAFLGSDSRVIHQHSVESIFSAARAPSERPSSGPTSIRNQAHAQRVCPTLRGAPCPQLS
jgi:DnaJ domain